MKLVPLRDAGLQATVLEPLSGSSVGKKSADEAPEPSQVKSAVKRQATKVPVLFKMRFESVLGSLRRVFVGVSVSTSHPIPHNVAAESHGEARALSCKTLVDVAMFEEEAEGPLEVITLDDVCLSALPYFLL